MRQFFSLMMMLAVLLMAFSANGEDADYETVYVLCQPDSYVNIRESPRKNAHIDGYAYCSDAYKTDGKTSNGFIHLVRTGTENGDGWISTGYVVYCKPESVDETWIVESNGRVAARSTIDGARTRWLKPNDTLTVYYVAEVAVTNRGFVDARYLSPIPKDKQGGEQQRAANN